MFLLNGRPFTSTSTSSIQPRNMVYPIIPGYLRALRWRMVPKPRGCVGGSATAAKSGKQGGWSAAGVRFPRKKFQLHRRPSSSCTLSQDAFVEVKQRLFATSGMQGGNPFLFLIVCESLTLLFLLSYCLFPFALARTFLPSIHIREISDVIVI